MTTAIIGTGNIGGRLAADLVAGGAEVLLAGRDLAGAKSLADSLGTLATAVTVDEAVEQADVIVLAVWLDAAKELLARYGDRLSGKVLVDPSNPIAPDGDGGFVKTIGAEESSGLLLAALVPAGATLVKAFGTLSAGTLSAASRRTPEPAVGFYAADDATAGEVVARLITAAGFDPVRIGGLDQSIRIEVFGDLHEFGALGKAVNRAEALAVLSPLTAVDRFEIFEQLALHQRRIDNDASRASADKYLDLYWPEATFTVHDLRTRTFTGPEGLKSLYDYAHSVFPLEKWFHDVGWFEIDGGGDTAVVSWRWLVNWKEGNQGVVSTGTYQDRFERRAGVWKVIERVSDIDPNWPAALFQPYVDRQDELFIAS
ncbi:NAD(P)-binding domain-containing protein [Streptomyces sp. H34-S4]|uniref:NAD(P)-binding domain-containing protein n=1 Tax=Streptomyces sp. H34-S4 TaxID=2996463 RepID=UPI00227190EC|nr:NAD(P)-binding domain-containing protein [Streptomyces sp. H34-S4]MCY0939076.1 NAD(P)-binding domain-containing protein [Streptomyces sp. H34-S4]